MHFLLSLNINWLSPSFEQWFILTVGLILLILLFRVGIKRFLVSHCNKNEIWLPVVDDAGNIIGRVAKSISLEEPGRFQHPIIRVMVWNDHQLYLKPRLSEWLFEKGLVDHPIEQLIYFGENVEETLMSIREGYFPGSEMPRFVLKYKHENREGSWLVLLYEVKLTDKSQLKPLESDFGKFWTLNQINENRGKAYFSGIFEGEAALYKSLQVVN